MEEQLDGDGSPLRMADGGDSREQLRLLMQDISP
jgi:hypothetical protein